MLLPSLLVYPSRAQENKWAAYASKGVREVLVVPTEGELQVQVVVKKCYEEWWMGWESKERYRKEKGEWVQKTGFQGGWRWGLLKVRGA
jgi:hypothetical protein